MSRGRRSTLDEMVVFSMSSACSGRTFRLVRCQDFGFGRAHAIFFLQDLGRRAHHILSLKCQELGATSSKRAAPPSILYDIMAAAPRSKIWRIVPYSHNFSPRAGILTP